ncbi:hypothetical protein [Herpetosiphon geysericola]|uniref:hypothetical protein n=1 Tax=Herpetosiphon geysericola TaxID=70996 RepID=UPI0006C93A35|nr:hypothetical protein [Herpetosiphon geysericola]
MSRFSDVTNIWSTIKEIDVRDIRDQADLPCRIALLGHATFGRDLIMRLLTLGAQRFPARTPQVSIIDLPLGREQAVDLNRVDLVLLTLDSSQALSYDEFLAYEKLAILPIPLLIAVWGTDLPKSSESTQQADLQASPAVLLDPQADPASQRKALAKAVLELLPESLHIAAARRYPGLRSEVTNSLLSSVALSNATFAFTSGLPEMIPVLNLPLNAADMLVLTKNQALLAYRVALAMGAEGDFSAMIRELLPVVGGGFLWRQLARQLVGLIPGIGLLPKVAVAYAGTFVTGIAAWRWYERGELISKAELQSLVKTALEEGRQRAKALIGNRKSADSDGTPATKPRLRQRLGSLLNPKNWFKAIRGRFKRKPKQVHQPAESNDQSNSAA